MLCRDILKQSVYFLCLWIGDCVTYKASQCSPCASQLPSLHLEFFWVFLSAGTSTLHCSVAVSMVCNSVHCQMIIFYAYVCEWCGCVCVCVWITPSWSGYISPMSAALTALLCAKWWELYKFEWVFEACTYIYTSYMYLPISPPWIIQLKYNLFIDSLQEMLFTREVVSLQRPTFLMQIHCKDTFSVHPYVLAYVPAYVRTCVDTLGIDIIVGHNTPVPRTCLLHWARGWKQTWSSPFCRALLTPLSLVQHILIISGAVSVLLFPCYSSC